MISGDMAHLMRKHAEYGVVVRGQADQSVCQDDAAIGQSEGVGADMVAAAEQG